MRLPRANPSWFVATLLCCCLLAAALSARAAGDAAALVSVTIQPGTEVMPRSTFIQRWTFQNTGTNSWKPGQTGYTLNLLGADSLGGVPFFTNVYSSWYQLSATIDSGKTIPPGGTATFSMQFIAPETSGSVTDTFQLNSSSSVFFGPQVSFHVVVQQAGSTNQYDRARAVSYANNYAGYVVTDGYFWTNGSTYYDFGVRANVPTAELGDDCAHYVSCCIGAQSPTNRGGGLFIPSRVPPTYGEPGVARLINTCLLAPGYATEVTSLSQLSPGDLIGWNWEGDTNIANLDHATVYLGNGLLASHSASAIDVAPSFFQDSLPNWRWHLIHIYDAPTLNAVKSGGNFILSWGTNWTGYALYSSPLPSASGNWTKVSKSPVKVGTQNVLTNAIAPGALFYRLTLP